MIDLKANTIIYYKGLRYGVLYVEKKGLRRSVVTLQRVNKAGHYIHSPIKVHGVITRTEMKK